MSMQAKSTKNSHFILIKHPSETSQGALLTASESCKELLSWGFWPLFQGTRCRLMVAPGNSVLIYTAGQKEDARRVVAKATVAEIAPWTRSHARACPIFLEGIPVSVLVLQDVEYFENPTLITDHLDDLSFIPTNRKKWGVAMMGGMRSIGLSDYQVLSSSKGGAA